MRTCSTLLLPALALALACKGKDEDPSLDDTSGAPCDSADLSDWYADGDGDGYGVGAPISTGCEGPEGSASETDDCDDADPSVHPWAFELVDGVDNNCDDVKDWLDADGADLVYTQTEGAGVAPVGVGDLDGDGADELLLGVGEGAVAYLVLGGAGRGTYELAAQAVLSWRGDAGSELGAAVAGLGDVDDDGVPDMGLGAPSTAEGGTDAGGAWLVSGAEAVAGSVDPVLASFLGAEEGARVGAEVSAVGDVDGDGLAELAFSGWDVDRGFKTGVVWMVRGEPGLSGEIALREIDTTLVGNDELDDPPLIADLGDVDGDGLADLMFSQTNGAGLEQWAALMLGERLDEGEQSYRDADAFIEEIFTICGPGDVDGDGLDDVLGGDRTYGDYAGAAWLFLGGESLLDAAAPADASAIFQGALEDQELGTGLERLGDLDGDGHAEPMVGGQGDTSHGDYTGAVFVFPGAEVGSGGFTVDDAVFRVSGKDRYQYLGRAMGAADQDGDGAPDLLLGAYDGYGTGDAYVLRGGYGALAR